MPIEEYVQDQPVRFRGLFYSDAAMTDPVDPATIVLWLRDPSDVDTQFTYSLTEIDRNEEGDYEVVHVVDSEGAWKWRWETTQPSVVLQGVITVYARNAGT